MMRKDVWRNLFNRLGLSSIAGAKSPLHAALQPGEESTLRSELFSIEQLQVHAQVIAGWHKTSKILRGDELLSRLTENHDVLLHAYEHVSAASAKGRTISPGGEWLIDNYYLIDEQIRTARRHLPKNYSRQLPQLQNGPTAGMPRVYHIALELVAHLDGRIDVESVTKFIASYQSVHSLRIGELWAVPIMLRLALIENVRRISSRVAIGIKDRKIAESWAVRLIETAEREPAKLILAVADMARSDPLLSNAFVAEFAQQLRGKNPSLGIALTWVEQRLSEQGQSVEEHVHQEAQQQAANQVSMGNSIASLRVLSAIDWREFVEGLSFVEHTLRRDPAGVYAAMDFATRDQYRHAVEEIAKRSNLSESQVAQCAIDLADRMVAGDAGSQNVHVGYFLINQGRAKLETEAKARQPFQRKIECSIRRIPLTFYLGSIFLLTALFSLGLLVLAENTGVPFWALVGLAPIVVLVTSKLAVALVNWAAPMMLPPRTLPRMDFTHGIAAEYPSMVVVPTMLTSRAGVEDLLERLEVHYLSNRDPQLSFALLTDFKDASQESMPQDADILSAAVAGVQRLNKQYGKENSYPFYLFHRPRRWSRSEGKWIGYERKRGKLTEFNAVLRGGEMGRFHTVEGDRSVLQNIRYVITLDTDTELPRDAARMLIATMAHPLNQPRIDAKTGLVREGYAILQPRVAVNLPSASKSWFVKLLAADPGIDPYTRVVSDLYQDLFHEGSFVGKGIYDVRAFEKILDRKFPDNRILSHDLLEGCYARSGVVSDIQLYEDHPWHFLADMRRRHRWIRGDWQIASWLLPWVPGPDGRKTRNTLSGLSRWKLFDNLRRSLIPLATLILLLMAWLNLPSPGLWTLAILAISILPEFLSAVMQLTNKPKESTLSQHIRTTGTSLLRQLAQTGLALVFLPYEALSCGDAILRTLFRLLISHRHLLEWETASDAQRRARNSLRGFVSSMLMVPLLALTALSVLVWFQPSALVWAAPFLVTWSISPVIAWGISQPIIRKEVMLSAAQHQLLRVVARKTWRFFETFVGPEDHDLPPDNYQEYPVAVTAHRTSPTNIGLGILSTLAAHDFGYITAGDLIERTGRTLSTMELLTRYRGHFLNWYDTRTLQPLPPQYVSTVDSGNLVGLLMTYRQGILELPSQPILNSRTFAGIGDTAEVLSDEICRRGKDVQHDNETALLAGAMEDLTWIIKATAYDPQSLLACVHLLEQLHSRAAKIAQSLAAISDAEIHWATGALAQQCRMFIDEIFLLAPWVQLQTPQDSNLTITTFGKPELATRLAALHVEIAKLDHIPALQTLAALQNTLLPLADSLLAAMHTEQPLTSRQAVELTQWLNHLQTALNDSAARATQRLASCEKLAGQSDALAQMDFQFLYDKSREQLAIGFNATDRRRDNSFYDLLASESRLGSFVAIAQGQLPQETWFALGRTLTSAGGQTALISWSGSMFEYLMPLLIMPTYDDTLLDRTYAAVVARQEQYGHEHGVPWGISESGYNMTDAHMNYQYLAFGIPGLGFKRGLTEDLVIAPYATVMSLMVDPEAAADNMQRLKDEGILGRYGFYEAIDYTPARVPLDQGHAVIRSFMSHHSGMSFLALAYRMLDRPMQKRFLADPSLKATELLLHERVPQARPVVPHAAEVQSMEGRIPGTETLVRILDTPDTLTPQIHLLSNGRYHVMVSNSGGGYSRWKDMAVTRWREDPTCDAWGSYCYIRDVERQSFWSATHQPVRKEPVSYEAIFQQARAEFIRQDNDIRTHTEIGVSPEDDIEIRRVTLTNQSRRRRMLDITSYAEVVIATSAADAAHPAFGNLFVQTEIIPHHRAILCTRRPRSAPEHPPYMLHLMAVEGTVSGDTTYETDRNKFIGRGRTTESPAAMEQTQLSSTQGAVLDPIVSIRQLIALEPGESARVVIVTGMADTRDGAMALAAKYSDPRLADRVFEMAWTHSQVTLRQLGALEADAQLFSRLAGSILYPHRQFRAEPAILARNRRGQSGLWGYSISGDLPIVLLRIGDQSKIELVRQMCQAHSYWRSKGLAVDLIIWNEDHSGYRQALQDQIIGLINAGPEAHTIDRPGGIFVRRSDQISEEDRILMQTVARVIFSDAEGTFDEQVEKQIRPNPNMTRLVPVRRAQTEEDSNGTPHPELAFFNGLGGFTKDGKEYVISTDQTHVTPAPWVNVLANIRLGTVISESGGAYTWFQNAHECRLTPWLNDPVSDGTGEAFYIRDDETGEFWSPTPLPASGHTPYITRHGMGYSVFEHTEQEIRSELSVYVATDAPVKFAVLKITNQSDRTRQISVAGYWEWVLGDLRSRSLMHVVTELDVRSGALLARNSYSGEFGDVVAFVDVNDPARTITGDRTEFLGRNQSLASPAAMDRRKLSGKIGAGLDPCAAILVPMELADGQQRELVFIFGAGQNLDEAQHLIQRFRSSQAARKALEGVTTFWAQTLGAVQVETPDPSVNMLANGWLLYQTLACRMWARSGFYQSGGAYGFRDQLQDAMALVHAEPALLREHLLRCAGHQFREGDVQHWWHPPAGRGVRTHFSDDFLWLPLATCRYVMTTGDTGVLDERVNYLEGRAVKPEEEAYYDLPARSPIAATLYDHCIAAIENGLKFGAHGLPLMGCGDWNDGMNLVGEHGKGESVWLAFFMVHVLEQFAELATQRGDIIVVERCKSQIAELRANIELHGWDGAWYRRAYFDNGEPLGSSGNEECQIDALPQSWSVIAKVGDSDRRAQAMAAVDEHLVRRDAGIIQLFTPPFDKSALNPGYIKGYVPGVRENGGQYTHAAVWTTMAFAMMGQHEKAWELFAMINPINRGGSESAIATYKVEPYVVAADVYGVAPHTGRGGWTWYTGSAGWMYRLIVETLLGLTREPERLRIRPRMPASWSSFALRYRYHQTYYHITITRAADGVERVVLDNIVSPDAWITLRNDVVDHHVSVQVS